MKLYPQDVEKITDLILKSRSKKLGFMSKGLVWSSV